MGGRASGTGEGQRAWARSGHYAAGDGASRRCGLLVETLPELQHNPNRPEDVLKVDAKEESVGRDDASDALRYLVAAKARVTVHRRLSGV